MSILISKAQELKPAYDYCLRAASEIDTRRLTQEMDRFVLECFWRMNSPSGGSESQESDKDLAERYALSEHVIRCIRENGERLKKFLSRKAPEEFHVIIDLARQLVPYYELKFEYPIMTTEIYSYRAISCLWVDTLEVNNLVVYAHSPYNVLFMKNDKLQIGKDLREPEFFLLNGHILTQLAHLYEAARAKLSSTVRYNEGIMAKMNEIVSKSKATE